MEGTGMEDNEDNGTKHDEGTGMKNDEDNGTEHDEDNGMENDEGHYEVRHLASPFRGSTCVSRRRGFQKPLSRVLRRASSPTRGAKGPERHFDDRREEKSQVRLRLW